MINIADPPRPKGTQPVISADLEQALGTIKKGAEERLEALRSKAWQLGQGETSGEMVPVLVGHIEKMEPGDYEEEEDTAKKDEEASGGQSADRTGEDKEPGKGQMTDKPTPRKPRSTPSVSKIKKQRRQAMIKEQERHWQEVTKKGLGDVILVEVDLEEAMMSEGSQKQEEKDKDKPKEAEGYGKVYTKTHETRSERSLSRAEKRKQEEKWKKEEAERKAAQLKADKFI